MIDKHVSPLSQAEEEEETTGSSTDAAVPGVSRADQRAASKDETAGGDRAGGEAEDQDVCRECEPESPQEEGRVRAVRDPGLPTPEERARHELLHVPFRPWCEHCVKGKAADDPHPQRAPSESGGDDGVPKVSIDYGFIKLEDTEPRTVLVLKVSGKGSSHGQMRDWQGKRGSNCNPLDCCLFEEAGLGSMFASGRW